MNSFLGFPNPKRCRCQKGKWIWLDTISNCLSSNYSTKRLIAKVLRQAEQELWAPSKRCSRGQVQKLWPDPWWNQRKAYQRLKLNHLIWCPSKAKNHCTLKACLKKLSSRERWDLVLVFRWLRKVAPVSFRDCSQMHHLDIHSNLLKPVLSEAAQTRALAPEIYSRLCLGLTRKNQPIISNGSFL